MISELSAGQGNVNVEGTISEIGEVKSFNKFGRELRVANAILKDDSGTIKLTLWNDDVSKFKEGDKIKIENGYVNEFQGESQLTAGKFGKMVLAEGGESSQEELSAEDDASAENEESSEEETAEDTKVDESAVTEGDEAPSEVPVEETGDSEDQEEAVI